MSHVYFEHISMGTAAKLKTIIVLLTDQSKLFCKKLKFDTTRCVFGIDFTITPDKESAKIFNYEQPCFLRSPFYNV